MELIELNLNKVLLLENHHFKNPNNSIDFLNSQAVKAKDLDEQMTFLQMATHKVEKFHSFFHFEQSFFHLQLALNLLKNNQEKEAKEQLELAIFQDHCNDQAIAILEGKPFIKTYKRVYENFDEYIEFATEEKVKDTKQESYWLDYEDYLKDPKETILRIIIDKIREHHLNYHIEAAKLYLNRAIIFFHQGEIDLAKNDLRKAFYLDSKVKEKDYYLVVEMLVIPRR